MKKIAAIAGLLVLGGVAQAQTVYGNLGYQSRSFEGSTQSLSGFSVGAALGFEAADLGGVVLEPRIGLNYANQTFSVTESGITGTVAYGEMNLAADLLFKVKMDSINLYAGPSIGYAFGSVSLSALGLSMKAGNLSGLNYGVVLGGEYKIDPKLGIILEGNYKLGKLSDGTYSGNSSSMGVKLGVSYKF